MAARHRAALKAGRGQHRTCDGLTEPLMDEMVAQGNVLGWPTIAVGAYVAPGRAGTGRKWWESEKEMPSIGVEKGA